jgi:phosphoglycolate phosphatase
VYAVPIAERFGLAAAVDGVFGAPPDLVASDKASVIATALASLPAVDRRRALMVGDREHDVAGARAHGVDTLGAGWGYAPDGELQRAGAVGIVGRPDELAEAVLARLSAA